ncbi:chloride intracellular channel protein 1-like [Lineus longissimus]|uniref:chloride intracellular channel protein 1-like n=1 Tax=Lineus longissimus TaxID=88925 RepID=UPI00315D7BF0
MASKSDTVVKLFIKPSTVKNTPNTIPGACPICQEWFMALYCLSKDFQKFEFTAELVTELPSTDWIKTSLSKPPGILILKGTAPNDDDLTGLVYDSLDVFLEIWECQGFLPPKRCPEQGVAEKAFLNLYGNFNAFLRDSSKETSLLKALNTLNKYLEEKQTKFLLGDHLSYADCTLIPKLHHLKIAAEAYKGFTIPLDYIYVWRYLKNAYKTSAFDESQPFDEDIVFMYQHKASCPAKFNPQCRDLHQTKTVPKEAYEGEADDE